MSVSLTSQQTPVSPVPKIAREDGADTQDDHQADIQTNNAKASSDAWRTTGTMLDITV